MAKFDSIMQDLLPVAIPELVFDSAVVSKITNNETNAIDGLISSNKETRKNSLQFKVSLASYDFIDEIKRTGLWFGNEILNKYLKFKVIFANSRNEEQNILLNPQNYVIVNNKNIKTLNPSEFQPTEEVFEKKNKLVITVFNDLYVQNIADISYLSLVLISYYDKEAIAKDFSIDFSDAFGVDTMLVGNPISYKLAENGIISSKILDLSTLSRIPESIFKAQYEKRESIKQENYFSDIFATYDNSIYINQKLDSKRAIDGSNIVRFGFFFDLARFVRENSVYGVLAESKDRQVRTDFINNSRILDLKFFRNNRTKDTYGDGEYKLLLSSVTPEEEEGSLTTKTIADMPELLFFTGIDREINSYTSGKFKYGFEAQIFDPALTVLDGIKTNLVNYTNLLKYYKVFASKPRLQSSALLDTDPHIDTARENIFNKASNGFYIKEEDRFSNELLTKIDVNSINKIIGYFIKIYNILLEGQPPVVDLKSLGQLIKTAVLPPLGNPDGIEILISLYDQLYTRINSILAVNSTGDVKKQYNLSAVSRKQELNTSPNFIKIMKAETEFGNFIANADISDGFGFNFFNNNLKTSNMLRTFSKNKLQNTSYDQFLYSISYRGRNRQLIDIVLQELAKPENLDSEYSSYSAVDFLVSLYGKPQFESVLSNFKKDDLIQQQTQNYSRLMSVGNVLENNGVSAFTQIGKIFEDNIGTLGQGNVDSLGTSAREQFNSFISLADSVALYRLTAGLLNNSRLINDATLFENKMMFYKQDQNNPISKNNDISEFLDSKILKTSKFKLKYETVKQIFKITFKKTDNGDYMLKEPEYTKLSDSDDKRHLCVLKSFVSNKAFLPEPAYSNIPVHNDIFIYDASAENKIESSNVLQNFNEDTLSLLQLKGEEEGNKKTIGSSRTSPSFTEDALSLLRLKGETANKTIGSSDPSKSFNEEPLKLKGDVIPAQAETIDVSDKEAKFDKVSGLRKQTPSLKKPIYFTRKKK